MSFLYQIGIFLYQIILKILTFFGHKKATEFIKGRKKQKDFICKFSRDNSQILVWFHCASLGEFEQGKPIIQNLKNRGNQILLTFFSPSGYEQKKNEPLADYVLYLPLDNKVNARKFIKQFNPDKAFFVKYEIWPNYFTELNNNNIPLFLISSTFRDNQIYFKPYGKWFLEKLKAVSYFFVQDESSLKLLNSSGFSNVIISGDTRFDNVNQSVLKANKNERLKVFSQSRITLIMGSSWQEEESMMASIFDHFEDDFNLIIVPHDVSNSHINQIRKKFEGHDPHLFSDESLVRSNILIIDSIGLLRDAYQYADIAFIGGGFKNALHNILEPAVFGLPVLFGNNHKKYIEAQQFVDEGIGFEISNPDHLKNQIEKLKDETFRKKVSEKATAFVQSNLGATQKVIEKIKEIESGEKQF